MSDRPIIDHIEGIEADDRASLFAAWRTLQQQSHRRKPTDLHVREFAMYVFATDKDGRGVQLSHDDIAVRLECTRATARAVVKRSENEYGIVAVTEQRYATGGQSANRYSIDWPIVRSINTGRITRQAIGGHSCRPGVVSRQPPAVTRQGAAVTRHPYKDTPELNTRTFSPPTPSETPSSTSDDGASASAATDARIGWVEVEEFVLSLPAGREAGCRPAAWSTAIDAARRSGVAPDYVLQILTHYAAAGDAFKPGALVGRLRRCHVDVAPSDDWPAPLPSAVRAVDPSREVQKLKTRAMSIERDVVKQGRRQGRTEDEIAAVVRSVFEREGLPIDLSPWASRTPAESS